MLVIPGIIAVSVHNKRLIHVTRGNWQPLMWQFLLYSFGIMFVVNFVMYLSSPGRTVSYSPWTLGTDNNVFQASFVFKYTLFAIAAALCLPKIWERRMDIIKKLKERRSFKIADDE
jgi:hypothetical protein